MTRILVGICLGQCNAPYTGWYMPGSVQCPVYWLVYAWVSAVTRILVGIYLGQCSDPYTGWYIPGSVQ